MSFHTLNCPSVLLSTINETPFRTRTRTRTRNLPVLVQSPSILVQIDESRNLPQSRKISTSGAAPMRSHSSISFLNQAKAVGIIGGVSASSTLSFLEKLVKWSTRDAEECLPFVVFSDPAFSKELLSRTSFHSSKKKTAQIRLDAHDPVVENLLHKRAFVEQSGAGCVVMPCQISHAWHGQISEGCSIPFLHVGECVARELKEAKLRPLAGGSGVRIGVLATDATLHAGIYQEKLQSQGFEVVLPDKATMEHILIPAIETLKRGDMEGARNLLRIAIQILLVRAVNAVILASDEMLGVLPHDDPLLKKCIDPMDALAWSTLKWARPNKMVKSTI